MLSRWLELNFSGQGDGLHGSYLSDFACGNARYILVTNNLTLSINGDMSALIMETSSIFQYQSARRYLLDYVSQRKSDPTFSIRKWTKSMGMNSHAHFVMILQGKRPLNLKLAPALAQGMRLSTSERQYFQALIQFDHASSEDEKNLCLLWLNDLNPGTHFKVQVVDEYLVISHWVHMAILAMAELKESIGTAEAIHKRLGGRVPLHEVRCALERLRDLGFIEIKGDRILVLSGRVTTRDDVANRGAREYHKQVAQLGVAAIEQQTTNEREYQSFALSVPKNKIILAKEMIRKFRTQLCRAMASEAGDEVYQATIQFFRLTESSSEMVPKVDEGAGSEIQNKLSKKRKKSC